MGTQKIKRTVIGKTQGSMKQEGIKRTVIGSPSFAPSDVSVPRTVMPTLTVPMATTPEKTTKSWLEVLNELGNMNQTQQMGGQFTPGQVQAARVQGTGWFQKGALEEGVNLQTSGRAAFASGTDLTEDITKGILGVPDLAAKTVALAMPALNQGVRASLGQNIDLEAYERDTEVAKALATKANIIDEEKTAKRILSALPGAAWLGEIAQSGRQITPEDLAQKKTMQAGAKDYLDNQMEKDSVFAEKSDALAQSAGQMLASRGLQLAGMPWQLTMGITSFGSAADAALQEGASYEQAVLSGVVSAGAEVLGESLFKGSVFEEKGLIPTYKLTEGISNRLLKTMLDYGVDIGAEGLEEVFSEVAGKLGSALYKEEDLKDILGSEEAFQDYLDAFIGGGALAAVGNAGQVIDSARNNTDYRSGYTANEQKVVDKVYEQLEAERAKDGKKLTGADQIRLREEAGRMLEKGYIDTATIEEALGGDDYKTYRKIADQEDAILQEYETLGKKQNATLAEQHRYGELAARVQDMKKTSQREALQQKLSDRVQAMAMNDRLGESYNERSRRGESFQADITKYDKNQQETVQKAIDSGVLNNTNRSHEFVDMIAKITADKGVSFDFTNNDKLKESGFALEGRQVNGYKSKDGITLNIQSAKALNTVVGHEITHVLEGTELYSVLQETITEYAKSKGEYQSRYDAAAALYKDVAGADIEGELTADLVGDYLFNDADFVNSLATGDRSVFQKIYDEIKYLCKAATAGSKEARQLEKVRKQFRDAYREAAKSPAQEDGVKYSLAAFEDGRRLVVVDQDQDLFAGKDRSEFPQIAKRIINEKFKGKVIGIDNQMFFNGSGRDEYIHPSREIKDADVYDAKMKASTEIDNLLDAGVYAGTETDGRDGHVHKNVQGWKYYDTIFKVGERYFKARVNGADNGRGILFKDVTKIEDVTQDTMNSYGENPKFQFLRTSSMDIISQETKKASENRRNSLSNENAQHPRNREMMLEGDAGKFSIAPPVAQAKSGTVADSGKEGFSIAPPIDDRARQVNELDRLRARRAELEEENLQAIADEDLNRMEAIGYEILEVEKRIKEVTASAPPVETMAAENAPVLDDADAPPASFSIAPTREEIQRYRDHTQVTSEQERKIARDVANAWMVKRGGRERLKTIIRDYSNGKIANRVELFEAFKENFGTITYESRDEYLADIKTYLRTTPIKVFERIKGDIADYGAWQKSHLGKLRFAKDGMDVDMVYSELSQLYPGMFPEDIMNPTDQLLRMAEVAQMDAKSVQKENLDDAGIWAAVDQIHTAVSGYQQGVDAQKTQEAFHNLVAGDIAPPAPKTKIQTAEERIAAQRDALERELAENQRLQAESRRNFSDEINRLWDEYDAKRNKNTKAANDIQRRINNLHSLSDRIDADYEARNGRIAARVEKMHTKEFTRTVRRQVRHEERTERIKALVGNTGTWREKSFLGMSGGFLYGTNTLRRNLRDIVKDDAGNPDIDKADAIYDMLQGSYNRNEAMLNQTANSIRQPYRDLKITRAEDQYIQMLGEVLHNPDSQLDPSEVYEFLEAHKDKIDEAKVDKIIKMARVTYDELFKQVNEVLREQGMKEIPYRQGYFPHFHEDKQGWLGKILNWKTQKNEIPTDIAGLTEEFNPSRSWQSFNKERKQDDTDYSFMKGLDAYTQGALDWIYHIEDIQMRRDFENYIRYVHSDEGIQARVNEAMANEAYDALELQDQLDLIYQEAKNPLGNFVTDLRTGTNLLAGKKHSMDRGMEQLFGRGIYSIASQIDSRVSANMVGGSLSAAISNLAAIPQSWAQVNPVNTAKSLGQVVRNAFTDDGMIDKSAFLTNRLRQAERLYKTHWDKASEAVGWFANVVDNFSTQVIWRSKFRDNLASGMSENEAIADADQFAENVLAGRSRGNMPTLYGAKNPVYRILTKFQLEVANQYPYLFKDAAIDTQREVKRKAEAKGEKLSDEEVKRVAQARLVTGWVEAFAGAYFFNELTNKTMGRTVAFDPARIILELIRDLFDEEEEPVDALKNFGANVAEQLPYVGSYLGGGRVPISSALPYDGNLGEMITDVADAWGKAAEGEGSLSDWKSVLEEMTNPLYYAVAPMGGGQLRKTVQGLGMFATNEERPVAGSYTNDGKLRFAVEDTVGKRLQAAMFGRWASSEAQAYIEDGRRPLSDDQTQELAESGLSMEEYWQYRDGLKDHKKQADKLEYVAGLDLPQAQKDVLLSHLTGLHDYGITDSKTLGSLWKAYGASKEAGVFPSIPTDKLSYKDVDYEMTVAEFERYSQTFGNNANKQLEALFKTRTYRQASAEDQARMIGKVYDYARDTAKKEYLQTQGVKYTNSTQDNVEVYKINSIVGAIQKDILPEEYDFYQENQERYEFLKKNGVSYQEFSQGSEKFKEAWNWAAKNPEGYTVSKAAAPDLVRYRKYCSDLNAIRADKDANGKSISGSAKEKKIDYIDGLDIDYGMKIILYRSEYKSDDSYNYEIVEYLDSRSDISRAEAVTILEELGMKVAEDGTVTW